MRCCASASTPTSRSVGPSSDLPLATRYVHSVSPYTGRKAFSWKPHGAKCGREPLHRLRAHLLTAGEGDAPAAQMQPGPLGLR